MTDDNESGARNESAESKESSENSKSELRADGGHTAASHPASESHPRPFGPAGAPTIDGPSPVELGESRQGESSYEGRDRADGVVLQPFQELCGRLEELLWTDHDMVVILSSGTLRYPAGSEEARICIDEFEGREGSKVRVLRTPNAAKPLIVVFDEIARK